LWRKSSIRTTRKGRGRGLKGGRQKKKKSIQGREKGKNKKKGGFKLFMEQEGEEN